jgi:hypothetical protein
MNGMFVPRLKEKGKEFRQPRAGVSSLVLPRLVNLQDATLFVVHVGL